MTRPHPRSESRPARRHWPAVAAAALLVAMAPGTGRAGLIIAVQDSTVAAGSTGSFDVTLTNTGPGPVTIGGFAFEVTAGPGITLEDATVQTALPYVFAGNSVNGPDITVAGFPAPVLPGPTLLAEDNSTLPDGITLAVGAGHALGLGRVSYRAAANASGPIAITLLGDPYTNLADGMQDPIPAANNGIAFNSGTVHVNAAVPEPGSLGLSALAFSIAGLARWRSREGRAG